MNITGRLLTVLTLAALSTPAFASRSASPCRSHGSSGYFLPSSGGFHAVLTSARAVAEFDPPAGAEAEPQSECSARSAEMASTEPGPARLPVLHWPSLGGGAASFYQPIAPTYLPCLLDAGTPADQEDTLRLIRSHW